MTLQYSVGTRNAKLDAVETYGNTAPTLCLFTGAMPANCATANSGTVVATMTLPSDWLAAASAGAKAKSGTWQDTSADASGTVGYFRFFRSNDSECFMQGTCSNTGGGGDMTLDNTVVNSGQSITISTFQLTAGNA